MAKRLSSSWAFVICLFGLSIAAPPVGLPALVIYLLWLLLRRRPRPARVDIPGLKGEFRDGAKASLRALLERFEADEGSLSEAEREVARLFLASLTESGKSLDELSETEWDAVLRLRANVGLGAAAPGQWSDPAEPAPGVFGVDKARMRRLIHALFDEYELELAGEFSLSAWRLRVAEELSEALGGQSTSLDALTGEEWDLLVERWNALQLEAPPRSVSRVFVPDAPEMDLPHALELRREALARIDGQGRVTGDTYHVKAGDFASARGRPERQFRDEAALWVPDLSVRDILLWDDIVEETHDYDLWSETIWWIMEQPDCDRTTVAKFLLLMVEDEMFGRFGQAASETARRYADVLKRWSKGFYAFHSIDGRMRHSEAALATPTHFRRAKRRVEERCAIDLPELPAEVFRALRIAPTDAARAQFSGYLAVPSDGIYLVRPEAAGREPERS